MELNKIGGPAHGIVSKSVHKILSQVAWGSRDGRGSGMKVEGVGV